MGKSIDEKHPDFLDKWMTEIIIFGAVIGIITIIIIILGVD